MGWLDCVSWYKQHTKSTYSASPTWHLDLPLDFEISRSSFVMSSRVWANWVCYACSKPFSDGQVGKWAC